MRKEIRISGFGGQGIVLAGYILGKAAAIHEGNDAVMTQSYGPEARGGASSSNVVIADRPIDYPFVENPDILIALSQEAYTKYRAKVKSEAKVIIDDGLVDPYPEDDPYIIPATALAEKLGRRIVANMILLGHLCAITDVVSRSSLEQAIRTTVKEKTIPLNLEAFNTGFHYQPQRFLKELHR